MRLPESWVQTSVRAVVTDLQPGFAQKPGDEDAGTTPQIRTHNVTPDGQISLEGIKHITASKKELARYSLAIGDVVFNNTNSEEWVGKTAVFDQEGEFVFSNHMTRLRVREDLVRPDYLAAYLQLLWSRGYSKTRAKRWVSQAGIESETLAAFKIPLPTCLEQQRIVSLVQKAEGLRTAKQRAAKLCRDLGAALFEEHFGIAGATDQWPMESFGKYTTYSKYGPRFPDQAYCETGVHVLRTTDMNVDGTIRWWEAPKLALTDKQVREHALKAGTLVISRSGSIGPFAIFDGPENQCVAGAYLIEFGLTDSIEPEYVRALFATPYVQRMLLKAVRSVAQPNINAPNIRTIQIPVPPRDKQEVFSKEVRELREWTKALSNSASAVDSFCQVLVAQAFSGELTAQWRTAHKDEVEKAASARDALLQGHGSKLIAKPIHAPAVLAQVDTAVFSARHWLLSELSDFQRHLLIAFTTYCQASGEPLLAEDPDAFARFCDDTEVSERLQSFGTSQGNRIRRTLSQLAALGLIAKVALPKVDTESGERDYLKAFRPLREDEYTRLADVQRLRKALEPDAGEEAS